MHFYIEYLKFHQNKNVVEFNYKLRSIQILQEF